ncbi:MAG: PH domain-containing protein, partial [Chloroflexi bacterium]|nr:PH domain-containing protein [Chloroflexota bacterium]
YEFLWLHTTEIPVSRIVSISESRGFFESLTGRGSVVVASGVGARQTVRFSDIDDPGEVADSLRATIE